MNNLYSKAKLLADDIEALDKFGRARVISDFIEKELNLKAESKFLDEVDVQTVQGRAADLLVNTQMVTAVDHYDRSNFAKDPNYFRTACLIKATIELLRGKNYLSHIIGFRKARTEIDFCDHSSAQYLEERFVCRACGKTVRPTMWVEVRPALKSI